MREPDDMVERSPINSRAFTRSHQHTGGPILRITTFPRHNEHVAKGCTIFLLSLVVGLSACDRGQTSVESNHQMVAESVPRPLPCGQALRLDDTTVKRLSLDTRLPELVTDSGITDEELKQINSSNALLKEEIFDVYGSAYSAWYEPTDDFQEKTDYAVAGTIRSKDYRKLSTKNRVVRNAYLVKFEKLTVKAHNLGRNDAETTPCPY